MAKFQSKLVATMALVALSFGPALTFAGTKTVNGTKVRDWQVVDIDKDGSISPEEMDKFLRDTWAKNAIK